MFRSLRRWIVPGLVASALSGCPDDERALGRGPGGGAQGGSSAGEAGEAGFDGSGAGESGAGESAGGAPSGGAGANGGTTAGRGGSDSGGTTAGRGGSSGGSTGGTSGSSTGGTGPLPCQGASCSCEGLEGDACSGVSCCSSQEMRGGPFTLGGPGASVSAEVASYRLDTFEVTVGRFRNYVEDYVRAPGTDSGENDYVVGSGWRPEWDGEMPEDSQAFRDRLGCDEATWTDEPGDNESLPMNCVTWYEAFAFCVWDGGRFPTEAEWEFAAAGGDDGRVYPWGNDPEPNDSVAVYGCGTGCTAADFEPVGSKPDGAGRYGGLDLAGSVAEWTLDYFAPYPVSCDHCANVTDGTERVTRGGHLASTGPDELSTTARASSDPAAREWTIGFRCARPR